MKTNKKGISLIVLVITIIVIIILAAAVILTLNNNNPINNSKQATFDNDCAELKSAMSIYITTFMAKDVNHDGPFGTTKVSIVDTVPAGKAEAVESSTVGDTREPSDVVTWTTLGFSNHPASIESAEYDPTTGLFTIEPTNTSITTKTNW